MAYILGQGLDPYVAHACEREPVMDALGEMKPEFYAGHIPAQFTGQLGIKHVGCFMHEPNHIGFSSINSFLRRLMSAGSG
jgi:hypothetical protein